MKKSQIKKSLNTILPTQTQKELMLSKILQHKKVNYINIFKIGAICLTVFICLIALNKDEVVNPNIRIMSVNSPVLIYKNKDYCQGNIYKGNINKLKKQNFKSNAGGTIYKKGKSLFLENNNTFYELNICRGE